MLESNQQDRRSKWLFAGGLGAAFTASLCCIGPPVFIALGLGSFAVAGFFESLRPWLAVITVIALGFAWRQALRKPPCEAGPCKTAGKSRKSQMVLMSLITLISMGLLGYPAIANWKLPTNGESSIATGLNSAQLAVAIPSMDCPACAVAIQGKLNKLEGVDQVQITYANKTALIVYDRNKINEQTLIKAIKSTGFPPETLKEGVAHVQ